MSIQPGKTLLPTVLLVANVGPVHADMIAAEFGAGIRQSHDATVVGVRYQRDWVPLEKLMSFFDLSLSTWNGPQENTSLSGGLGLRYDFQKDNYFSASAAIAYVSDETPNLGTEGQFIFRFAYGHRIDRFDLSVAYAHYSNGKALFNWDGPNRGEDFVTFQIGYYFGNNSSQVEPLEPSPR